MGTQIPYQEKNGFEHEKICLKNFPTDALL